ncbi:hypothetical protein H6P81_011079 [Aristolochia fimbriata]|uniref:Uncharacterized protein n=1 Tax=Aristolochia fimbriata TaxID=158543 RepID=A0AAV7ER95_ARIFI|nr:hypothetical protein H6P81_011079 [Aristolochia fimbriata]
MHFDLEDREGTLPRSSHLTLSSRHQSLYHGDARLVWSWKISDGMMMAFADQFRSCRYLTVEMHECCLCPDKFLPNPILWSLLCFWI